MAMNVPPGMAISDSNDSASSGLAIIRGILGQVINGATNLDVHDEFMCSSGPADTPRTP